MHGINFSENEDMEAAADDSAKTTARPSRAAAVKQPRVQVTTASVPAVSPVSGFPVQQC